jgi:site-specific recombinase XerD
MNTENGPKGNGVSKSKKYCIDQLVTDFGSIPLRQFNSMLLEQYQSERLQEGYTPTTAKGIERPKKGNKPATVNRLLATLKHMFTKGIEWDMVSSNPVKHVKLFRESSGRVRYLEIDEIRRLLDETAEHLRPS